MTINVLRSYPKFAIGLRTQLVVHFVTFLGGALILYSFGLFRYVLGTHLVEFDAELHNFGVDLARSLDDQELAQRVLDGAIERDEDKILPFSLHDAWIQLRGPSGEQLAWTQNAAVKPLPWKAVDIRRLEPAGVRFETVELGGEPYRMQSHWVHRDGKVIGLMQIAVPMRPLERERGRLITFFATSIPVVLLLAAFGGLLFTRRALKPVAAITNKANQIEAHRLSERIPEPRAHDEIRELARTLNGLLNRLEGSFRAQEAFIADASHQLKTPLSILQGELEMVLKGPRAPGEIDAFLLSARQEIGYLTSIVEGLLTLARLEANGMPLPFRPFRLDEKLLEAVQILEPKARRKGVHFKLSLREDAEAPGSFELNGDEDLVRSLLENILDNAIKYSPPDGAVDVSLSDVGTGLEVSIADEGPGIPDAVKGKVFERFFRSETTRDHVSGSGLGLAIVQRVAEHHGAQVDVRDRSGPGTEFRITLPKRVNPVTT